MAKRELQSRAVGLRKEGKSYREIRSIIPVSKGTLSLWLREYPLSKERIRELRDWNERRIEHYRETRQKTREQRLSAVYEKQKKLLHPLLKQDIFLAGLFLYWGEGSKTRRSTLAMTNTDPSVLTFFLRWLEKIHSIPRSAVRVALHLYSDMDITESIQYWSNALRIPLSQFGKPYIKKSRRDELTRKGGFGHGTCEVRLFKTELAERVLLGVKVIRDHFGP